MNSDTYGLLHNTGISARSKRPLAYRRTTTGAGIAMILSRGRRRTGRGMVHPWCEHCGTTHRDRVVTAECFRLLINGPDWPE
ncbi:hypothetical protein MCEL_22280 [Mycolicibacterium celeriflavum]|uniref:Uncharacterized protein n=1 Tax=Mycolicibacterium celeriflavum TaxID=1249101 RepID=A0A7I7RHG4_MYCCF|nr:hypothetical protein MCEL_22280 [Mycolicibacterium celeriflavum]